MAPSLIKRLQNICLGAFLSIIFSANLINYFYFHKYLEDIDLQWAFYNIVVSTCLFLASVYFYLDQFIKRNKIGIATCAPAVVFLFINNIGVMMGYTLHSKGFVAILFITLGIGLIYSIYKIRKVWLKYF